MSKPRKIVWNNKNYTWRAGKGYVVIKDENNKSQLVHKRVILGISHDDFERLPWKSPGHIALAVTPQKIIDFLNGKNTKPRKVAQRSVAECCYGICDYNADAFDECAGPVMVIDEVYNDKTGDCYWTHLCEKHQNRHGQL